MTALRCILEHLSVFGEDCYLYSNWCLSPGRIPRVFPEGRCAPYQALYTAEVPLLAAFLCSRNSLCILDVFLEILFSGEDVPLLVS